MKVLISSTSQQGVVFFICLYLYFNGRYNSDGSILIRADKYAEFIGIDRTMAIQTE